MQLITRIILCLAISLAKICFAAQLIENWHSIEPLSDEDKITARSFQYVFVGGFLNEGIINYFSDNILALKNEANIENISIVYPPSSQNIEENSEYIMKNLRPLLLAERKIVIIGHSKGAVESLLTALKFNQELNEKVVAWILVQGAFHGSFISDYLKGEKVPRPDEKMPWFHRISFLVTSLVGHLLDKKINRGIESLLTQKTEQIITKYKGNLTNELNKKIYYITSYEEPKNMSELIDCTGYYLRTYFGENDGLVLQKHQSLNWIGETIANLRSDHAALMVSNPISNVSQQFRLLFTRNLLRFLARIKQPRELSSYN